MVMKNPPHPGELVADTLDELGWSVTDAARGLGMSRQQLHNVISGRSAITPALAVKLEQALGSSADTWLRLQNSFDLAEVGRHKTGADALQRFAPKHSAGH